MRRMLMPCLALMLAAVLCAAVPARAETRTALVIGNAAYASAPLKNPVNDARDMASALRGLGFEVILKTDATHKDMEAAVREFGQKLRRGGVGLFYFAGHGVQVAGENYLVPVDAQISSEADVKFGCLNAGLVLGKMEDAGNQVNLVVLDACRNNPFSRGFRGAESGLAKMDAPTGSLIAYATAPGRVAEDGSGNNGVYTKHLLQNIRTPGVSLGDVFMRTRMGVLGETAERQVPWESSSLTGYVYLAGKAAGAAPAPAAPAPVVGVPTSVAAVRPQTAPVPTAEEARLMQAMREEWSFKHDLERVRKLAKPLAAKGSIYGQYALGWLSDDDGQRRQAIARGAEQGIALAMAHHAEFLEENPAAPGDESEARAWLQKAVALGEPRAKASLGELLIKGTGGPKDVAAGERLLAEAARALPGYNLLVGTTYLGLAGKELPKEIAQERGMAYLRRGAALGDANAMTQLGFEYLFGKGGVAKSEKEAVWWFAQAAAKDSVYGMTTLAGMLRYGRGPVAADPVSSARWFRRAAELGSESGVIQLAQMTMLGEGVTKDVPGGLATLKGLADKGSGYAQVELGKMYEMGEGVPQNLSEAYFWFTVSVAKDDIEGRVWRDALAPKLDAAQRAEIEARAARWKPKAAK